MGTPDSSACLRAHVDAALDPTYERLFALSDLLAEHRQRANSTTLRIVALSALLSDELEHLDLLDSPDNARTTGLPTPRSGS
jgi:hypothetical protein